MIPRSEQTSKSPSFWTSTGSTLLCHLNLLPVQYDPRLHQQTLDYLSNLTPHSVLYNETVLRLRRTKRASSSSDFINHSQTHKSINTMRYINEDETHNKDQAVGDRTEEPNSVTAAGHEVNHNSNTTNTSSNIIINNTTNSNKTHHHHHVNATHHTKINTEKHWRIMKNKIHQKIKFIDSHNQPITPLFKHSGTESVLPPDITPNCHRVSNYAWLFILTYIVFAISLFTFLILSESTVFTVTIITSALPLIGIFWSLFELRTAGNTGMSIIIMFWINMIIYRYKYL